MSDKPAAESSESKQARIVIAWDPKVVSESQYSELITALGNLVRAENGVGVHRIDEIPVGATVFDEAPA